MDRKDFLNIFKEEDKIVAATIYEKMEKPKEVLKYYRNNFRSDFKLQNLKN